MANNPTVFTDEAEFNAAALPVNFDPVIAPDVTPLMEQNKQTTINNFKRAQEQGNKNLEWENTWAKFADDTKVAQLEKFSETLTNIANIAAKKMIEKQESEGEALAHSQGAAHIAEIEGNVPGDTARAIEGQALANDLGAAAEDDGAPTEVIRNFENLGAYAKVAYTNQLLQTAGNNYSQWRQSEEAQSIKVPVPDGQGGMKYVDLKSAGSSAEIAAITTEVKKQYLSKYRGLGTLTGRNKYLWQKMDEHETAIANARGEEMRQAHEEERKADINNQMIDALKNGPAAAKEKLEELTKLWGGRYTPQGLIDNVFIGLGKALDTDQITGEDVEALLEMDIVDRSRAGRKKPIKLKDSVVYRNALRKNGIANKIEDQKNRVVNKHQNNITRETHKLEQVTLSSIRQLEKDRGRAITDTELNDFINKWNSIAKHPDSNVSVEIPKSITEYLTAEDMAEDRAEALADFNISKHGYLPQDIADTLPYAVRNSDKYKNQIKPRRFAYPSSTYDSFAKNRSRAVANKRYSTEFGTNEAGTTQFQDFHTRAYEQYLRNYASNKVSGMSDKDAHDEAIKSMDSDAEKKVYDVPQERSEGARDTELYLKGSTHLRANNNDFSNKIPGLDTNGNKDKGQLSTIEKLDKIANGESFRLPQMFVAIGEDYKPINGVPADWALAAAQYKAYTGKDLPLPTTMGATQNLDKYTNKMLYHKPSTAKSARVVIGLHPKNTGNEEKSSDNKSDSKKEEKKPVEGDTNKDGVVNQDDFLALIADESVEFNSKEGKNWTVADMITGFNNNEIDRQTKHSNEAAVGLYGVTQAEIEEAYKAGVVKENDVFDAATQNKIIIHKLQQKCLKNNSLAGLRERYPSLSTVKPVIFEKYMTSVNPKTPFNDAKSGCVDPNLITAVGR